MPTGWTQPVCEDCREVYCSNRRVVRHRSPAEVENCYFCSVATQAGMYVPLTESEELYGF